jgi:hypothetical protein
LSIPIDAVSNPCLIALNVTADATVEEADAATEAVTVRVI